MQTRFLRFVRTPHSSPVLRDNGEIVALESWKLGTRRFHLSVYWPDYVNQPATMVRERVWHSKLKCSALCCWQPGGAIWCTEFVSTVPFTSGTESSDVLLKLKGDRS